MAQAGDIGAATFATYLATGDVAAATVRAQSGKFVSTRQAAEMTSQAQTVLYVIGIVYG
jgi:hypothetical protein